MFIGHFGVGFGARSAQPSPSLGSLFLATQWLDLLWPTFLLLGIERVEIVPGLTEAGPLKFTHFPFSHSLLMALIWGVVLGSAYWLVRRNATGALVMGLGVLSHWLLDLIVHRPDLPLYPGDSPLVGLGLWNSLAGTIAVELLIFAVGLGVYLQSTRAKNKVGAYGLWALVGFLLLIQAGNFLSPPPTDVTALAWTAQLQWLIVGWAYWVDRNRVRKQPATPPAV